MGIHNFGESAAYECSRLHNNLSEIINSKLIEKIIQRWNIEEWIKSNSLKKIKSIKEETNREKNITTYNSNKQQVDDINKILGPYNIASELGGVACKSLIAFFNSVNGKFTLEKLDRHNIEPKSDNYNPINSQDESNDKKLHGSSWVITGTLTKPREHYKKTIEALGGKVVNSVSKNTNYLLAGNKAGSKLNKAENLNVNILSEASFFDLIDS